MEEERTIVIDVKLTRGLVVALSCALAIATLLACLAMTGKSAVASGKEASEGMSLAQSTGMRQFYLTQSNFDGNEIITACVEGYHFASLWEIADPSNLKYDTYWGATSGDSGQGPPSSIDDYASAQGWVRTGYITNTSETRGKTNCNAWVDDGSGENGTVVRLVSDWVNDTPEIGVWDVYKATCNIDLRVWCVED
jgi:hypothetical protein